MMLFACLARDNNKKLHVCEYLRAHFSCSVGADKRRPETFNLEAAASLGAHHHTRTRHREKRRAQRVIR
jgi:hypothetical protein